MYVCMVRSFVVSALPFRVGWDSRPTLSGLCRFRTLMDCSPCVQVGCCSHHTQHGSAVHECSFPGGMCKHAGRWAPSAVFANSTCSAVAGYLRHVFVCVCLVNKSRIVSWSYRVSLFVCLMHRGMLGMQMLCSSPFNSSVIDLRRRQSLCSHFRMS
jgi:hypothetical protein